MYSPNHLINHRKFANHLKRNLWRMFVVLMTSLSLLLGVVTAVSAARLYVPVLAATKTDSFVGTHDGDGKADPGETIQYNVVINNTGADPATGVTFTDTIDSNTSLVPSSVNVSPLAGDDTYATIGNTLLEVGVTLSGNPSVKVTGAAIDSLFDNDIEFLSDTFTLLSVESDTVAPFTTATESGGSVTVETDGNFSYTPPVGFTGADHFDYVITDDGAVGSGALTGAGRVTINVHSQEVWYVNNNAAAGGLGRSTDPFDTLLEAQTASGPNDTIFVFHAGGDLTGQNAGIILKDGQRLIGEAVDLEIPVSLVHQSTSGPNPTHLHNDGSRPTIGNAAGDGVTVSTVNIGGSFSSVEIRGLDISGTGAGSNAVDITTHSTFTGSFNIADNVISAAGGEGIDVNGGGTGAAGLTVSIHDNTITATGNGIDIQRTAGSVTVTAFDDNVVTGSTGGIGINVVGTGATVLFDTNSDSDYDLISGGTTAIGQSGAGGGVGTSGIVLSNVTGDLSFTDLDIYADNGSALLINGTTPNFNAASGTGFRLVATTNTPTLAATGGAALDVTEANINLVPTTLTSSITTATRGVSLVNVSGTLTAPSSASITSTHASGTGFFVDGGGSFASTSNVNVTYPGTITADIGRLVQIQNVNPTTAASYTFSGAITDSNDGDGGETGVLLDNNDNGTVTFSGGLLVRTTSNPAFTATNGGTVNVCDEGACNPGATGGLVNTLTSTTGTALNVANTTIGANNLEFRSISSSGGSSTGIILDTTGSSGGLKVKGSGSAGSGGTISSKTGSDGSTTTGIGIYLNNTSNVFLDRMQLNTFQNYAIRGLGVSGFTMDNSVINASSGTNGTNVGVDEGSVIFGVRAGTTGLTGTASITNTTIEDGVEDTFGVYNASGTLTLTMDNVSISSAGNDGIAVELHSTAVVTVGVQNSDFTANVGDHFQVVANDSADLHVRFGNLGGNTLVGGAPSPLGQSLGIQTGVAWSGTGTANISNNSINGAVDTPLNINIGGTGTFQGIINNNTIGTSGVAGSGTVANEDAIRIVANGDKSVDGTPDGGTLTVAVTNNIIQRVSGHGIFAIARDGGTASDPIVLNVTITGNTLRESDTSGANGIRVEAGASSTPTPDQANVCADIGGAGGLVNTFTGDWGGATFDEIRLRHQFSATHTFRLPGFVGVSPTGVPAYLLGRNSVAAATASATVAGGGAYTGGAACTQPVVAMLPNNNRILASAQPSSGVSASNASQVITTVNSSATVPETITLASGSAKLSKQAAWRKAPVTIANTGGGGSPRLFALRPAPLQAGETVTVPAFTLPAGKSVTVIFQATVNNPLPQNATRILNQGTISGSNFTTITTTESPADSNPQCTAAPSIGTQTCTPIDLVDLNVLKNNNTSGTVVLGNSFTWQVQVSNVATSRTAVFTNGQTVLEDHLPSGATYGLVSFAPSGGLIGTASCSITANVLTCTADPGGLSIAPGEGFATGFSVTPTGPGSLVNPTGGVCQVDPNTVFAENSTANNNCSDTVTVTRPETTVVSITRQSANPTTNPSVTWQVVFADAVDDLAASNFSLISTGTVSGATLSAPTETSSPPSTTWNITASGITGDGTLELRMVNDTGLSHEVTNLPYTQPANGAVYTIDNTAPLVSSIVRQSPASNPTNSDVLVFRVTFNEAVTSVGANSFVVNGTTTTINSVGSVTPNLVFDFTLDGGVDGNLSNLDGTVGLDIAASPTITDLASNTLQVVEPTPAASNDQTFTVDNTAPTVTINQAIGQADPTNSSPINFTVVFSEPTTNFVTGDVDLSAGTATGTLTGTVTEIAPNDDTTYNVAVSGMTSLGTVIASVQAGVATDAAGNANIASTTGDDTVTYGTDLSITKTDGVTSATAGGSVTYTITASNAGPVADTAATVADTFPASLTVTWTCVGAGGGTCTASGSGNINDTVNLPVGGSVTYTASATISTSASGMLVNTATVTSSVADENTANNSATDTDTITAIADLSITKTDGVTTAVPGGSVTYTITASNSGPSDVSGTVADTFPAILNVNWTCVGAGGGTCTASGSGNINDSVNLPAGGSVTYTASATISASATGSLVNTATVSSAATDPDPANNSATDTDTLTPQADLAITKTDGVTVVIPGGSTTYTITASNAGPSDAPGATVADTFPASITSASWTCVGAGGGTCTAAGSGNINDTVNLPAGGSVTYTVNATISGAASGTISNTATVSAPGGVTDPVPGNNSATDNDNVIPPVSVTINQAPAQVDPTNASSINFRVVFGSSVTDFDDASDVTLSGTAGATTVVITGGPTIYNVAVSGMTGDGTVIADIPANVATGGSGQPNAASTSTDKTVTYDGTAPNTTITSNPPNPTTSTSATFAFDGTDGVDNSFECQIDGGGFSGCSSPRSFSSLTEGTHTFEVRAIDLVGNVDPTPASYTWLIDLTAPNTIIDTNPTNPSNSNTGNFTFHGTDGSGSGIGSVECKLDSGSFAACDTLTTHSFTGLSEGSHTVEIRAIDNAGNTDATPDSYTWTVDTVGPDTTILTNPTNPTASTSANFTFSGSDTGGTGVASFQCQLDGGGYTTCTSPRNYTSLSDGSHTFEVRAIDNANNTDSSPASYTWIVDSTAPNTIIDSNPANPANSTSANFTFHGDDGTGVAGMTFQCKLDAGAFTACDTAGTHNYAGLSNGSHTFQVRATDSLGNVDPTPASYTWVVDTVQPTVVVSSVTTSPTNISPITITITFSEAVTGFTPSTASGDIVIGGVGGTDSNPTGSGTTYTFDLTPSGQGAVTVTVPAGSAQDAATNTNTVSNTFSITYDTVAPTVTINQAGSQADPTSLSPVNFTVVFNEPISVATFTGADVTLGGTAGATTAVVTQITPMDGTTFNVAVSGMSASGTIIPSITAVKVKDLAGNDNVASTSTDDTVTFDNTPLTVTINQAATQTDPDFASSASKKIHFTAVFSEPVNGFTAADISFAGTTLMGTLTASVTQIAPMDGTTYDVGVKGMIPKGTVFVSIPANKANSIARGVGNQASTSTDNNVIVDYVLVEFTSTDSKDGWVLESTETSGVGGSLDSTSTVSRVGDNASDQQYRSIVDFATGSLPDSAVLFSVNLRVIEHSITGTNPFSTHGALKLEVKSGFFGTAGALQNPDFESAPDKSACNFETVPEFLEAIGTAYRCIVFESAYPYINLTGTTQFKMRFATDDNDDMSADIFSFYTSDYGGLTQRPRLFIKYYIPPAP